MGKKLIIKGANFITNAITDEDYVQTTLYQAGVITNPSSQNYGLLATNPGTVSDFYLKGNAIKVQVPAGKSVKVMVYYNGVKFSEMNCSMIASASNVAFSNDNRVPNIVLNVYPTVPVQSDGSYLMTNTSDASLYMYIGLAYLDFRENPITGKTVYYAIVN